MPPLYRLLKALMLALVLILVLVGPVLVNVTDGKSIRPSFMYCAEIAKRRVMAKKIYGNVSRHKTQVEYKHFWLFHLDNYTRYGPSYYCRSVTRNDCDYCR